MIIKIKHKNKIKLSKWRIKLPKDNKPCKKCVSVFLTKGVFINEYCKKHKVKYIKDGE